MGAGFTVTGLFFDRGPVLAAMDKKTRKGLSKFGAFVMRRAKTSIKKPGKKAKKAAAQRGETVSSKPGGPPFSQVGTYRKLIYFSYDPKKKTVVIGPVPFEGAKSQGTPERIEKGGTLTVILKDGSWVIRRYEPRPAMRLAYEKELPNAPKHWA